MSSRPSILLVACDQILGQVYASKFEREGWDVVLCSSLADGEHQAVQLRPLILLFETSCVVDVPKEIRRLTALPTLQKTRIVVLDDRAHRIGIREAHHAGASEYLVLGHFSPLAVVNKMKKFIGASA